MLPGSKHSDKTRKKMRDNHWDSSGRNNPSWKNDPARKNCLFCQKPFYVPFYRKDKAKYCSSDCYHKGVRGKYIYSNNPNWKGGRCVDKDGYILIKNREHPFAKKNGYMLEHRLVVEKQLGRYLTPEEVVHHQNEIKDDNRIENLIVFASESAHQRFHTNPNNVKIGIVFDGRHISKPS